MLFILLLISILFNKLCAWDFVMSTLLRFHVLFFLSRSLIDANGANDELDGSLRAAEWVE